MYLHAISQGWTLTEQRAKADAGNASSTPSSRVVTSACVESFAPNMRLLIQRARLMRSWTIADLGERVGVLPDQIREYESGHQFPMADILGKLQDELHVRLVPLA